MGDTAIDEAKVKEALDEVRPMLQADGGDVEFVSIEGFLWDPVPRHRAEVPCLNEF